MTVHEEREELLLEELPGGVLEVTLNRPDRLNALSADVRRQLLGVLRTAGTDGGTRVVIVTGAGGQAFSAGQDLNEAKEFASQAIPGWIEEWRQLFEACLGCPKPIIAAVNGYAVGAALQLAAVCDIRVAADHARVGLPEVNDAIPCITGTWALADLVGLGVVADLTLTGRLMSADEAAARGLFSHVVPLEQLAAVARAIAADLAAKSPMPLALNKENLRRLRMASWPDTEREAVRAHEAAFATGEPAAVMTRFLSGRAQRHSAR